MFFTKTMLLSALALSTTATAGLIGGKPDALSTPNPAQLFKRQDRISCEENTDNLCGTREGAEPVCDEAINTLRRGTNYYLYAASTDGVMTGQCATFGTIPDFAEVGCGIFLEGPPDCKGSGDDLWNGAQQIRGAGCAECGVKFFTGENGGACQLKIDYVSECFPDDGTD